MWQIIHTFDFCTVNAYNLTLSFSYDLKPSTFDPDAFLLAAGFKHSQPNLIGGSWPRLCRSLVRQEWIGFFNVAPEPQTLVPPSFSSCVKCPVLWCSLNLSGHYSPPSASTSHPSSFLFALFHPALCLAPSPHSCAKSADYSFPLCLMAQLLHHCSNCAVSILRLTGCTSLVYWQFVVLAGLSCSLTVGCSDVIESCCLSDAKFLTITTAVACTLLFVF